MKKLSGVLRSSLILSLVVCSLGQGNFIFGQTIGSKAGGVGAPVELGTLANTSDSLNPAKELSLDGIALDQKPPSLRLTTPLIDERNRNLTVQEPAWGQTAAPQSTRAINALKAIGAISGGSSAGEESVGKTAETGEETGGRSGSVYDGARVPTPEEAADMTDFKPDAIVVGAGFGGPIAALRLAQAGQKVLILERGQWFTQKPYGFGKHALWLEKQGVYGHNNFRFLGATPNSRNAGVAKLLTALFNLPRIGQRIWELVSKLQGHVISWLGSGVGGGSHVWGKTVVRTADHIVRERFPSNIAPEDLAQFYDTFEYMLDVQKYPDYAPYNGVLKTQAMKEMGKNMEKAVPGTTSGPLPLAIHFAPKDHPELVGQFFVNKHGVARKYYDPRTPSQIEGDWLTTAGTDSNYLPEALKTGNVRILPMHEVDKIEVIPGADGTDAAYRVHARETSKTPSNGERGSGPLVQFSAKSLYLAAGAIGTTELLLRNARIHKTLTRLSPMLGRKMGFNGDRGGLAIAEKPADPYEGPINTWGVWFPDGVYLLDGAYIHPNVMLDLGVLDALGLGAAKYAMAPVKLTRWLRKHLTGVFFRKIWPIPVLGVNNAPYKSEGIMSLDPTGHAVIDIDLTANDDADARTDMRIRQMSASIAPKNGFWRWFAGLAAQLMPDMYRTLGKIEAPHNHGGVPMGGNANEGAADHTGKVYGYTNIYIADGSLLPPALGANPTGTLSALAERSMIYRTFPQIQADLQNVVKRVLGNMPENLDDTAMTTVIEQRLSAERERVYATKTTGKLHRPEGKLLFSILNLLDLACEIHDGPPRPRLTALQGRLFRWISSLTPETLIKTGAWLPHP